MTCADKNSLFVIFIVKTERGVFPSSDDMTPTLGRIMNTPMGSIKQYFHNPQIPRLKFLKIRNVYDASRTPLVTIAKTYTVIHSKTGNHRGAIRDVNLHQLYDYYPIQQHFCGLGTVKRWP